jgi:hypothetical protein
LPIDLPIIDIDTIDLHIIDTIDFPIEAIIDSIALPIDNIALLIGTTDIIGNP